MEMQKKKSALAPTANDDKLYHLHLKNGDIPGYVLIPGDPGRTLKIANNWEDSQELAYNREYRTIKGTYKGVDIATTSTGIGCQSSEIVINELYKVGAHTCIRVGTAGSISPHLDLGDLIIPSVCMRKGGTAMCYVEPEFPAFANIMVIKALMTACENLGFRYTLGVNYSTSSFYLGQGRPLNEDGTGYWPSWASKIIPDLQAARISSIDMDTAGQYIVGFLHGLRMGAILSVNANRITDRFGDNGGEEKACLAATEAIKLLSDWDAKSKRFG